MGLKRGRRSLSVADLEAAASKVHLQYVAPVGVVADGEGIDRHKTLLWYECTGCLERVQAYHGRVLEAGKGKLDRGLKKLVQHTEQCSHAARPRREWKDGTAQAHAAWLCSAMGLPESSIRGEGSVGDTENDVARNGIVLACGSGECAECVELPVKN